MFPYLIWLPYYFLYFIISVDKCLKFSFAYMNTNGVQAYGDKYLFYIYFYSGQHFTTQSSGEQSLLPWTNIAKQIATPALKTVNSLSEYSHFWSSKKKYTTRLLHSVALWEGHPFSSRISAAQFSSRQVPEKNFLGTLARHSKEANSTFNVMLSKI